MVRLFVGRWCSKGRYRCRGAFSATPHPSLHSRSHHCPRADDDGRLEHHRSKDLIQKTGVAVRGAQLDLVLIRTDGDGGNSGVPG
jgi:hypothetical protein